MQMNENNEEKIRTNGHLNNEGYISNVSKSDNRSDNSSNAPGKGNTQILVPLDGSTLAEMALPHAIALARAPGTMEGLKKKLRSNRLSCPLFATDLFRNSIEKAYIAMWQAWQKGEAPIGFSVEPGFEKNSGH